jgi:hypothetical protein
MPSVKKIKLFFGIAAGLIAYAIVGKLGLYLLQISWADYDLHNTDKSYTTAMLLARQLVGVTASAAAGIGAAKTANDNGRSAWLAGAIIFCGGSYIHFMTITWTHYPVWYHFTYVLLIIPVTVLSHFLYRRVLTPSGAKTV